MFDVSGEVILKDSATEILAELTAQTAEAHKALSVLSEKTDKWAAANDFAVKRLAVINQELSVLSAKSRVELTITDLGRFDELSGEADRLKASMDSIGKAGSPVKDFFGKIKEGAQSAGINLGILSGGLGVAGVAFAAFKVVQLGQELYKAGAAAMSLDAAFKTATDSAGMMSNRLLHGLQAASAGTVNFHDLQLGMNTALTLGVQATADDYVKIMQAAKEKAEMLGRSTIDVFTSIVSAIGTGRTMSLVGLGFDVKKADITEYAKSIGTTVAKMTEAQQQQFVLSQVIAQAQAPIAGTQDKIEAMSASWQNFREAAGKRIVLAVESATMGPNAGKLLDQATQIMNAATQIDQAFGKIDDSLFKVEEHAPALGDLVSGSHLGALMMMGKEGLGQRQDEFNKITKSKKAADAAFRETGDYVAYDAAIQQIILDVSYLNQRLIVAAAGGAVAYAEAQSRAIAATLAAAEAARLHAQSLQLLYTPLTEARAGMDAWAASLAQAGDTRFVASTNQAVSQITSMATAAAVSRTLGMDEAITKTREYTTKLDNLRGVAQLLGWSEQQLAIMQGLLTGEFAKSISVVDALKAAMQQLKDAGQQAAESSALGMVDILGVGRSVALYESRNKQMADYVTAAEAAGKSDIEIKATQTAMEDQWRKSDSAVRKLTEDTGAYQASLDALASSIESIISASIAGTKGLQDFTPETANGYDPNGPAVNFGRMWDVAVNGFNSQWLEPLRKIGLIPQSVIDQGEAKLKAFAEGKARAFQAGTDLGMLDVGKVVEQVRTEMAATAALEAKKKEIMAALKAGGVTGPAATKALDKVLGTTGVTPEAAGISVDGVGFRAQGSTMAGAMSEGFKAGLTTQNMGGLVVASWKTSMTANIEGFQTIGTSLGDTVSDAFVKAIVDGVGNVRHDVATVVAPEVAAIIDRNRRGGNQEKP